MAKTEKKEKTKSSLPKLRSNTPESISIGIMGFANFMNGQMIKGFLFLAIEAGYLWFMITSGISALTGLVTLGTQKQGWVTPVGSKIPILADGDNSMIMMIYGVAVIVLTIIFVGAYLVNLHSARQMLAYRLSGVKAPGFVYDMKSLADQKFHVTLMTPSIIGILLFTILPLIFMILIAFTNYDKNHQPPGNLFEWVGISNFVNMLGADKLLSGTFFPVLGWTLIWAIVATGSNYILGIMLALLINKKGIRFKGMWRTIFVLTIALPQFITLLVMRNMFNEYGPINEFLVSAGILTNATRILFLNNVLLARITVLVVNLWIGVPYTMLISSGILMNIPADMYEAAKIDGASPFKLFVKITMPYMIFVTTPYLITQFIGNINNFNVIFLLTGGNPTTSSYYQAGKTDLLVTWLYKLTVNNRDYSYASTIGIVVFVITASVALITYRNTVSYKREEEFS